MPHQTINYRSYHAMLKLLQASAPRFRGFDVIVGIPLSGVIPATILASTLGIPFATLDSAINRTEPYSGFRSREEFSGWDRSRLLVVDDSVNNGHEIQRVKALLDKRGLDASYLAVFASPAGVVHVDHHLEIVEYPRLFEWNILNHPLAENSCYDMDGVLCHDPTDQEKADDDAYRTFLLNARPLYVPRYPIGRIVTSRLERYRAETEAWLSANGIQYGELIMMQHVDADTRQRFLLHSLFKADIMKRLPAWYFVESALTQARVIARVSGRPCFSVEGMSMCFPGERGEEGEVVDRLTHLPAYAPAGPSSNTDGNGLRMRLRTWLRGSR